MLAYILLVWYFTYRHVQGHGEGEVLLTDCWSKFAGDLMVTAVIVFVILADSVCLKKFPLVCTRIIAAGVCEINLPNGDVHSICCCVGVILLSHISSGLW